MRDSWEDHHGETHLDLRQTKVYHKNRMAQTGFAVCQRIMVRRKIRFLLSCDFVADSERCYFVIVHARRSLNIVLFCRQLKNKQVAVNCKEATQRSGRLDFVMLSNQDKN